MKRFLFALMMLLLVASVVLTNILFSSGFFRDIQPGFEGEIIQKIQIPGVEDIAVSREDQFLILSSDDRAARRDGQTRQGDLYLLQLNQKYLAPKLLNGSIDLELHPHGISLLKLDSSKYQLLVVNHVGNKHFVEHFALYGDSLVHEKSISDPLINSPNDVTAVSENEFYVTNDHRYPSGINRVVEDYLGLALSNVVYYHQGQISEVAAEIAYANGILYDADRELVFVAAPRDFEVKVYERTQEGRLNFREEIPAKTGVDNIEMGPKGKLWIGCHPNLLKFTSYAQGRSETSPSEVITIDYRGLEDYTIQSIFVDDGSIVSGSTVAVPINNKVFIGNVMDDKMVVWELSNENPL